MISNVTKLAIVSLALTSLAGTFALAAQDKPKSAESKHFEMAQLPTPEKEHGWLQQIVGEWTFEAECSMGPDAPPMKSAGTESIRALGGFWIICNGSAEMMGQKVSTNLTLGYSPERKKYIGTWIDSVSGYMWHYVGTVDAAGKALTLETEGPNFMAPGKMCKFREVLTITNKNQKSFTSSMLGDDGKWVTIMTAQYRRKE